MSVQFLIGRAGSGKTSRLFEEIVRRAGGDPLGPPIYWLLPKQATFQVERRLAVESGLPGLCRVLVLSFDQFGEMIRQQCGGIAIPQINAYGRQMILGHLLRVHQNELRFFRSVARQPGLAARLDEAFTEFDRAGRSAADLDSATGTAPDPFDPYSAKLHDLRLMYAKYEDYLGQDRLDPHRRLTQILGCIEQWPEMKLATVMVDEFLDLAAAERDVLVALARGGANLSISVLVDPESAVTRDPRQSPVDVSLFHRTEQTYRNLWKSFADAGVHLDPPLRLPLSAVGFSETLRLVESEFFGSGTNANISTATDICLIEAPDRRSEVDAVARHIGSLLDAGHRLRDIAVLARDLADYHDAIASSFAEHGLPCFIDRRRPANHHPLIRFARLLPLMANNRWPNEAIIGLCKTGLLGMSAAECDELECYVLHHRIDGAAWVSEEPWNFHVAESRGETSDLPARMNSLRLLVAEKLTPWSAAMGDNASVKDLVEAMLSLFDRCQIQSTLEAWMTSQVLPNDSFQEHERVWTELQKLLQQMSELLGIEVVSPQEFADILETGLERFDLGVTPPTVDQVLVGAIDRTRTPTLKVAILIGWNDGAFPRSPGIHAVLSDTDRDQLGVGGDSVRRLLDEQFLAYFALTRASQKLCISRPLADDSGKRLAPSPYWQRMRELFPSVEPTVVNRDDPTTIATPRQLTTALMKWVETVDEAINPTSLQASLYQWMVTRPPTDTATITRQQAWPALSYRNHAILDAGHIEAIFQSPIDKSIRQIESFAACPFQHFADAVLRLRTPAEASVNGSDMSRLYSEVLGNVIGDMIRAERKWSGPSPRAKPTIRKHAAAVGHKLRDEIMISSARNRYSLERAQTELELTVATQETVAARGDFVPSHVNVNFGTLNPNGLPALAVNTPQGNQVNISGKIARIDLERQDGQTAASVIDYRLGENALPLDRVYHGLSLQLLTYLLVLQANGQSLEGRPLTPAAAFYVKMLRGLEGIDHPSEATPIDQPAFLLKDKMRGVLASSFIRHFDRDLQDGASQIVAAYVKKDGELGNIDKTDVALPTQFAGLLQLVRHRIGELIDRMMSGDIEVKPYRIGDESPCVRCSYRSVCRFDPSVDRYRMFEKMPRTEVLNAVSVEGVDA